MLLAKANQAWAGWHPKPSATMLRLRKAPLIKTSRNMHNDVEPDLVKIVSAGMAEIQTKHWHSIGG
ncbi:hypothetical protein [Cypionkella sinensis]|uniref:Uncharacterized protein n=1 Tax=Cypionkella sinensis TaxID=1756043 RepID=A0ABV7J288_9RHOB